MAFPGATEPTPEPQAVNEPAAGIPSHVRLFFVQREEPKPIFHEVNISNEKDM